MKRLLLVVLILLSISSLIKAQDVPVYTVVPNANITLAGGTAFLGPLSNSQRKYQFLISESELTSFVGKHIKGIYYRLLPSATVAWPAVDITYSSYEFFISGSVTPSARSLTFADNIVGVQKQVRSGPLAIHMGSYPIGGSPNEFGPEIAFDSTYYYTGGHMLIELRHMGFTGTSASIDALGTSGSGYGSLVSACYSSSIAATTGTQGNFCIIKLVADNAVPVELSSFTSTANGNSIVLNWSTSTETNNKGFYVERKPSDEWQSITFISGAGSTTEKKDYSFIDNKLASGKYTYRLKQVDFDGTVSYSKEVESFVASPGEFVLSQNYPNPFNPNTIIEFAVPQKSFVTLKVVNLLGETVAVLLQNEMSEGVHSVNFNASSLPSGVYVYQLSANNQVLSRKMILTK